MTPAPCDSPGSRHRLSTADLATLARGGGGKPIMRTLVAARRSRTLQLIRLLASHNLLTRSAWNLLAEVRRHSPEAADRVLDSPSVGAWATQTVLALRRNTPARPEDLAYLAAAAAIRGEVDAVVELPPSPHPVLPSLGVLPTPISGPVITSALTWTPDPEITLPGGVTFTIHRRWPAPPTSDLHLARSVDIPEWQDRIARAWALLRTHHPEVADELATGVTVLAPLEPAADGVSSVTMSDAFGCLFLSLGPDDTTVAVTLAHEVQHTKLVALMDLFPLVDPTHKARYYAPWRADPRPITGLLHGTYAYLGVTAFWRAHRAVEPHGQAGREFARWRSGSLLGCRTLLTSGGLTEVGHEFVTGMTAALSEWADEPVPPADRTAAFRLLAEHREDWLTRHS
ncbi:aKG-HExxH-type peptide beta-hydroxylase [Actinokineospora iranica]|uniref:HEXXH motif-containing protein n=1 Tax=Actinokineospora iranica TaxID=1271860 RepID=A0A1G6WPF3_9PSEU|nr:HEXXH motif-containing putative peptide modification protein [Actinokineospora iranica]SDD66976.1 HEXXH motif-containing protein [Actinokineospora iranica]